MIAWLATHEPGMYAIEVVGDLPDEVIEECASRRLEHRALVKAGK